MVRLLDLVVIVEEADQPEAGGDQQARPDIGVGEVHPQQHRDDHRDQDQQPAHGRRAALGEVALRAVGADRLALALAHAQPAR